MKRQRSAHRFRQRFRQRRLIWSWFLTYTVVLLLPIFSSILIFRNDQRIIRHEIDRSNQTLLELTQHTIDQRFEELQLVSYQMTLNPRFRRFTSVGNTMTPAQRMNHYQLTQDMIAYSAANEFVDHFFIYFENTGSFVGANTHLSNDLFYRLQVQPRGLSRETWDQLIAGDHRSNIIEFAEAGTNGEHLIFIQSLQQIGAPAQHTLLAFINKAELNWPSAHHPDPDHRVTLLIMDGKHQVLVNLGDLDLSAENLRFLGSLEEPSRYTIAGEDYMVSAMPSRALDLRYIVLTPSDVYWESSQQATMIIVIGALVSLAFGFLLIIYLLKRQYSPVSDLMSYLQNQNLDLEDSPHNELEYIKGAVESALQRKNTMEERLDSQNRQLRRNVMNRLLRGDLDAEYLAQTDFPSLDLVFPHSDYTVIVIYFDRYGDDLGLAHFILRNVVEELVSAIYPCYTTKIDSLMVCVVNHPRLDVNEVEDLLAPLLERSEAVIREHFDLATRIFVSEPVRGMENWTHAYHLATTSLTVSLAVSEPPGLRFLASDTQETALTDTLNHHQLANYLKIHDLKQAAVFIDETLAPHRAVKLTAEEWRYLHTQVLVTIVDNISEETRSQVLALEPFQKMDRLMYKQRDLRPYFQDLLRIIEEHEEQTERRSSSLIDEIDHYIDAHYADPALNLNRLGDLFHISPTYLAKQYKEVRGAALVDQLNKRRIREAKRYLREDPEKMLVDVAERCGFTNVNTFIRVFKKMEGITPGRYRDSQDSAI